MRRAMNKKTKELRTPRDMQSQSQQDQCSFHPKKTYLQKSALDRKLGCHQQMCVTRKSGPINSAEIKARDTPARADRFGWYGTVGGVQGTLIAVWFTMENPTKIWMIYSRGTPILLRKPSILCFGYFH